RYRKQACFTGVTAPTAPAQRVAPECALPLSLDKPHDYTLPSCGLPSYQASRIATHLTRLTYIKDVAASSPQVALAGGVRMFDDAGKVVEARLDVLRDGSITPSGDVRGWLQQTGAGGILGTRAEILLTAAFQDRAWRRFVEGKLAEQS